MEIIKLREDYVKLGQALKAAGLACLLYTSYIPIVDCMGPGKAQSDPLSLSVSEYGINHGKCLLSAYSHDSDS